jgi:hypothetical protein
MIGAFTLVFLDYSDSVVWSSFRVVIGAATTCRATVSFWVPYAGFQMHVKTY